MDKKYEDIDESVDKQNKSVGKKDEKEVEETNLVKQLQGLIENISPMSDDKKKRLKELKKEAEKNQKILNTNIHTLKDFLDRLRLNVKYLLFDLEATRRENTYLRRMLEETDKDE